MKIINILDLSILQLINKEKVFLRVENLQTISLLKPSEERQPWELINSPVVKMLSRWKMRNVQSYRHCLQQPLLLHHLPQIQHPLFHLLQQQIPLVLPAPIPLVNCLINLLSNSSIRSMIAVLAFISRKRAKKALETTGFWSRNRNYIFSTPYLVYIDPI